MMRMRDRPLLLVVVVPALAAVLLGVGGKVTAGAATGPQFPQKAEVVFERQQLGEEEQLEIPEETNYEEEQEVEGVRAEEAEEGEEEARKGKPKKGVQWAFLVAGSDGWRNYRHQADVCHAYHTLRKRGIPASRIIVMMKDDIANNVNNPVKGTIINKPGGENVYPGVKIDYSGSDVTPENFLRILEGNKKAMRGKGTGRVIQSTKYDSVFVNFDDHGTYGFVGFPNGELTAKALDQTVKKLIAKNKFGKLVFYIEACYSGSMFDSILPSNKKVLASTASGRYESSWACYCSVSNMPCLGDLYSVSWIEELDKPVGASNTLFDQFDQIRTLTKKSHVNIYGDYGVAQGKTSQLLGNQQAGSWAEERDGGNIIDIKEDEMVSSREATLHWAKKMSESPTETAQQRAQYSEMLANIEKGRRQIDGIVENIVSVVSANSERTEAEISSTHYPMKLELFTCYENIFKAFGKKCLDYHQNDYVLKHFHKFYNMCYLDVANEARAISAMDVVCSEDTLRIKGAH